MNAENNGHAPKKKRLSKAERFASSPPSEKPIGEVLCAEYDHLNKFWKKAESQLAKLHAPVFTETKYKGEEEYDYTYSTKAIGELRFYLGWQKYGGEWRICHTVHYYDFRGGRPDEEVTWRPIGECTADIRVEAVDAFPELQENLKKAAFDYVGKVKQASEKLAAALDE